MLGIVDDPRPFAKDFINWQYYVHLRFSWRPILNFHEGILMRSVYPRYLAEFVP